MDSPARAGCRWPGWLPPPLPRSAGTAEHLAEQSAVCAPRSCLSLLQCTWAPPRSVGDYSADSLSPCRCWRCRCGGTQPQAPSSPRLLPPGPALERCPARRLAGPGHPAAGWWPAAAYRCAADCEINWSRALQLQGAQPAVSSQAGVDGTAGGYWAGGGRSPPPPPGPHTLLRGQCGKHRPAAGDRSWEEAQHGVGSLTGQARKAARARGACNDARQWAITCCDCGQRCSGVIRCCKSLQRPCKSRRAPQGSETSNP